MALPKILHDNIFASGVTATDTDSDSQYSIDNIYDLRTYTYWLGASAGVKYFTMDAGAAVDVDSLGIISHNLGTAEASIVIESSTTGAWAGEEVNRYNPELVTNGEFTGTGNITGWTLQSTATNNNGVDVFDGTTGAASNLLLSQNITGLIIGTTYKVYFERITGTEVSALFISDDDSGYSATLGQDSFTFVASAITHWLYIRAVGATTRVIVDNVSVRIAETADTVIAKIFTSASAQYWRVRIATASVVPQVGVCLLGEALEFPVYPDAPFTPKSEGISASTSRAKAGSILGSVINHHPLTFNISFDYPPFSFLDGDFKDFWDDHGKQLKPFFWVPNLDDLPNEIHWVKFPDKFKLAIPRKNTSNADRLRLQFEGGAE